MRSQHENPWEGMIVVWTCPRCGAVTFHDKSNWKVGVMGEECNCTEYAGYRTVEDTVLVVWNEEPA